MSDDEVAESWLDLVDKEIDELPVHKKDKFADEEKILEGATNKEVEAPPASIPQ